MGKNKGDTIRSVLNKNEKRKEGRLTDDIRHREEEEGPKTHRKGGGKKRQKHLPTDSKKIEEMNECRGHEMKREERSGLNIQWEKEGGGLYSF